MKQLLYIEQGGYDGEDNNELRGADEGKVRQTFATIAETIHRASSV